jgi:hypothetical protein
MPSLKYLNFARLVLFLTRGLLELTIKLNYMLKISLIIFRMNSSLFTKCSIYF